MYSRADEAELVTSYLTHRHTHTHTHPYFQKDLYLYIFINVGNTGLGDIIEHETLIAALRHFLSLVPPRITLPPNLSPAGFLSSFRAQLNYQVLIHVLFCSPQPSSSSFKYHLPPHKSSHSILSSLIFASLHLGFPKDHPFCLFLLLECKSSVRAGLSPVCCM